MYSHNTPFTRAQTHIVTQASLLIQSHKLSHTLSFKHTLTLNTFSHTPHAHSKYTLTIFSHNMPSNTLTYTLTIGLYTPHNTPLHTRSHTHFTSLGALYIPGSDIFSPYPQPGQFSTSPMFLGSPYT